jgi:hypothetical protein
MRYGLVRALDPRVKHNMAGGAGQRAMIDARISADPAVNATMLVT